MPIVDPKRSALLVMDFQNEIVGMLGDRATAVVERTAGLIAAARKANIPVVYIGVAFRPGYPEVDPSSTRFAEIAKSGRLQLGSNGAEIVAALKPSADEPVVFKRRVNAFYATDLEPILRARHADTLILAGIATSGVVLSTVRCAADLDYTQVVVSDCCADRDEEVHRVLTEKVLARQAKVVTAAELIASL